jgi:hypothetical protein
MQDAGATVNDASTTSFVREFSLDPCREESA